MATTTEDKKKSRTQLIMVIIIILLLAAAGTFAYLWLSKDDEGDKDEVEERTAPLQSDPRVIAPKSTVNTNMVPGINGQWVAGPVPTFQSRPRPMAPGSVPSPMVPTAESYI